MEKKVDIYDDDGLGDAPTLKGIGKGNPFSVPDGYFDELPSKIMARCTESQKRTLAINYDKVFFLFKPQLIFILFIGIVGVTLLLRQPGTAPEKSEKIAATIPDSVLMAAVQKNVDYVDMNALEDIMASQGTSVVDAVEGTSAHDTAGGQIINYLIDNNIDASDLEKEL